MGGSGGSGSGGGGGGGRIALYYRTNDFTGTVAAKGGSGNQWGGAGTIFMKALRRAGATVRMDNAGHCGATTPPPDGSYEFERMEVRGNAVLDVSAGDVLTVGELIVNRNGRLVDGGDVQAEAVRLEEPGTLELNTSATYGTLQILSGGALTYSAGQPMGELTVTDELVVEAGGAISGDGKGLLPRGSGCGRTT